MGPTKQYLLAVSSMMQHQYRLLATTSTTEGRRKQLAGGAMFSVLI